MADSEPEKESVVTGGVVELRSSYHHHEGRNDYTNTSCDIVEIVARDGRRLEPVWETEWTVVAEGVETRDVSGTKHVRVFARGCPIRVRFLDSHEYVSYTDEEHSSRWARYHWVRYVTDGIVSPE